MTRLRLFWVLCALLGSGMFCALVAAVYVGRVVDDKGQPVLYATVYPLSAPAEGTATNANGIFTLSTQASYADTVVISFIGYEKRFLPLSAFRLSTPDNPAEVMLREQPVALEETVVEAKRTRKSKRKFLAQILHATYMKIEQDFPKAPIAYNIVSDVRLDASSPDSAGTAARKPVTWGMEQMIAAIREKPEAAASGSDSIQFTGNYCKRYCPPDVRNRIDGFYKHADDPRMRRMAASIDSGTVVHRALWTVRMDKKHLLDTSDELRRWKMTSEDNTRCVLTYTHKRNYLGIVKMTLKEHLIVDAYDFELQSYTVDMDVSLFLLFSIKLKGAALDWLNMFNMDNSVIEKFRLKRGHVNVRIATIYGRRQGVLVPVEKNMFTEGFVQDRKGNQIPVSIAATQQLTSVQTEGVSLDPAYKSRSRVPRVSVPIY